VSTAVIVGAGLAGARAAEALRAEGFEGRVVLLGDEGRRPYERPALSKGYLRGDEGPEALPVHDEGFYEAGGIELRADAAVVAIDRARGTVVLADGEQLAFDLLLLATGAEARHLEVPGADLDGVLTLRTVDDADRLRAALEGATAVAVVGGGWIGAEVAAVARQLGREVALVHPGPAPLHRILGPEVAGVYGRLHADHGVRLLGGRRVTALAGTGAVEAVVTDQGDEVPADLVVAGVGARPRTELASAAGLAVDDGVVVDATLRTADARIFAAGDVARAWHPLLDRSLRVEHWANALNQGPAAARTMLGGQEPYVRLPYFYSDQYDVGMELLGVAEPTDRVVFRGDPARREFIAFWIRPRDGRVVAAMNVNVWDVVEDLRRVIIAGAPVDESRLRDPDVALPDLAARELCGGVAPRTARD
jgi:3-phenylpropionate/trans-cinnamate dioxygenase ferredoxin reductase component